MTDSAMARNRARMAENRPRTPKTTGEPSRVKTPQNRLSEAALQSQVIDLAHVFGWLVAHFRPAQNRRGHWQTPVQADGAGWPDLVLVRERVIYAELKRVGEQPSAEQCMWLEALHNAGQEAYLWDERDWDAIVESLRRRVDSVDTED